MDVDAPGCTRFSSLVGDGFVSGEGTSEGARGSTAVAIGDSVKVGTIVDRRGCAEGCVIGGGAVIGIGYMARGNVGNAAVGLGARDAANSVDVSMVIDPRGGAESCAMVGGEVV